MTAYENTVALKSGEDSEKPAGLERRKVKIARGQTDGDFRMGVEKEEKRKAFGRHTVIVT